MQRYRWAPVNIHIHLHTHTCVYICRRPGIWMPDVFVCASKNLRNLPETLGGTFFLNSIQTFIKGYGFYIRRMGCMLLNYSNPQRPMFLSGLGTAGIPKRHGGVRHDLLQVRPFYYRSDSYQETAHERGMSEADLHPLWQILYH